MNDTVSEDVKLDEAGVEASARRAYFEYVDSKGYPNGLPTWDELPLAFPDKDGLHHPNGQETWREIARGVLRAYLAATKPPLAGEVTLEKLHGNIAISLDGLEPCSDANLHYFKGSAPPPYDSPAVRAMARELLARRFLDRASPPASVEPMERVVETALREYIRANPAPIDRPVPGYIEALSAHIAAALSAASAVRSEGVAAALYVPAYYLEAIKYRRVSAVAAASEPNEVCDTPLYTSPVQTREDGIREAASALEDAWKADMDMPSALRAIEALLSQPEPKGDKA